jgi:hypothetical protein
VVAGLHLRAEFRSLFAVADLLDYLPDIVDDDAAADALNAWLAAAIRSAGPSTRPDAPRMLQLRIAPAQLRRLDSLAGVVAALCEAGGGTAPCLLLPEAAVHRDAYLVIDAATAVAALGATLGIDDYRGLLPPPELTRAGIGALRVHRSLVRELGERPRPTRERAATQMTEITSSKWEAEWHLLFAGQNTQLEEAFTEAA